MEEGRGISENILENTSQVILNFTVAGMIFPWLETAMEGTNKTENKTAARFLSLMESLR